MSATLFNRLAAVATVLTLIVIVLGAWVRLSDAGLGCPDWPGCYGELTWPKSSESITAANERWADRPVDNAKTWREMIHRYVAATLGILVLVLAVMAWRRRRRPDQPLILPLVILGLVVFQALLGMWTVTLLLKPAVVLAHLLGGLATFSLLWWLYLRTRPGAPAPGLPARSLHRGVSLALAVLVVQIALGGWVSANYAALACPDFPTCSGQWWPETDFPEGFRLWRGLGADYEGGVLDQSARAAIHVTHRLGALVVLGVFGWLLWRLWEVVELRRTTLVVAGLLAAQVTLGILNILLGLPLAVAVAHNGVAALLLGAVIHLWQRTRDNPEARA